MQESFLTKPSQGKLQLDPVLVCTQVTWLSLREIAAQHQENIQQEPRQAGVAQSDDDLCTLCLVTCTLCTVKKRTASFLQLAFPLIV